MQKRFVFLVLVFASLASVAPLRTSPVRAAVPSGDKSTPFGLVTTLANRVREDEMGTAIALLREAGVQWAREEIFWDRLQPQRGGKYLWSGPGGGMYNYDAAIGGLSGAGINVLGLLDYNPAWFKSQNPPLDAWIKDWGDYVYNTVARYGRDRKQIKYWEVWNEENIRTYGYENGLYTVQDYVRVLRVARAAIKAADPEAVVVLGGVASIWAEITRDNDYDVLTYLQLLYDAGGWNAFDILAIHPYRPGAPEAAILRRDRTLAVEAELDAVDALNRKLGAKPIWITEVGWSNYTGTYGVSEDEQAAFMVRMYLLALAHPSVQKVFWYDFRDDTSPNTVYHKPVYGTGEAEYHFGLLRRQFPLNLQRADLRKPAFLAYRAMREILGGMMLSGVYKDGGDPQLPGLFAYRYDGGGRAALVLWRLVDRGTTQFTIQCGCINAHIRNSDGRLLAIVATDGNITVRLDNVGSPLYVEWGDDRNKTGPFFPPTGHHIASPFLEYWQANGGLAQFGYPISGPLTEPDYGTGIGRLVQYFERNRMEYDPAKKGTPFAVQIGRLGDDALHKQNIDWTQLPKQADSNPDCHFFRETGHQLCAPFRSYWEQRGGLAINGLPLGDAYDQNGVLTQYFERSRFEYHPDLANPVQLGLLGNELYRRWAAYP